MNGRIHILILFLIFVSSFFIAHNFYILNKDGSDKINWFIFLATASLAALAYFEFNRANKLLSNEFLLFISDRWGSSEILKARQIIHSLFVKNYRNSKSKSFEDYQRSLSATSKNILELSKKEGKKDGDNFIYLLNLIDFMETLGYS